MKLDSMTIAIIGYGSQGRAQAMCLRDSGLKIIIGSREGPSKEKAIEDGFDVSDIKKATDKADIILFLVPDEKHKEIFSQLTIDSGKTLCFSHGFSILYKQITPPKDIDVVMVAPNGIASEVREQYLNGNGVPCMIAVWQNHSGKALQCAKGIAEAMKYSKVIETTFEEEVVIDLFSEQNVLCGGLFELLKNGYNVLVENGYNKEIAYTSIFHELKYVVDTLHKHGIVKTHKMISNTAEWGAYVTGPKIIDDSVKKRMEESLKQIEGGSFAKSFLEENENGLKNLKRKRDELKELNYHKDNRINNHAQDT